MRNKTSGLVPLRMCLCACMVVCMYGRTCMHMRMHVRISCTQRHGCSFLMFRCVFFFFDLNVTRDFVFNFHISWYATCPTAYVYVCVYECVCVSTDVRVCLCTYACDHSVFWNILCWSAYLSICIFLHMCVNVYNSCVRAYAWMYTCMYVCMFTSFFDLCVQSLTFRKCLALCLPGRHQTTPRSEGLRSLLTRLWQQHDGECTAWIPSGI